MADDSARIRIELDDSGVPEEARALGVRIRTALRRGLRGFERDLRAALSDIRVQVRVEPDLRGFNRA
ncbi:hypothetical protein G3I76_77485, partial [Streptomyces sp. SID11233]|nr:hypothetical protein [Streptomyces sp. SID11233]